MEARWSEAVNKHLSELADLSSSPAGPRSEILALSCHRVDPRCP
jgi:hypothetical protein